MTRSPKSSPSASPRHARGLRGTIGVADEPGTIGVADEPGRHARVAMRGTIGVADEPGRHARVAMRGTIGLGCMRLSTVPDRDDAHSAALLDAALAAGITIFDTSDAYALDDDDRGHNERLIREARARHASHPNVGATAISDAAVDAITVITKGGLVRPGGAWVPDGRARHLAAAARASRERLALSRDDRDQPPIDIYLLHAVDPRTPLSTSVRALAKLRADGVVRSIGLSNVTVTQLESAVALAPISAVQVELNPWKVDAVRGGLLERCRTRGITVYAHRPLGGPAGIKRAARDPLLVAIAEQLQATPAEVALAWIAGLPGHVVPLPGATRIETIASIVRAASLELPAEVRRALDARFLDFDLPAPVSQTGPSDATKSSSAPTRPSVASAAGHPIEAGDANAANDATPSSAPTRPSVAIAAGHPIEAGDANAANDATPSSARTTNDEITSSARTRPSGAIAAGASVAMAAGDAPASEATTVSDATAVGATADARAANASEVAVTPASADGAEIVVIMGMPAAGKTTIAQEYVSRGYRRLNRDERGGSLAELARALDRLVAAGARRVVVDNTYPTRASRAAVIQVGRKHGVAVRGIVVATALEDAQAHAAGRILSMFGRLLEPDELAKARRGQGVLVPNVQFRWRREYEPPQVDEGFAALEVVEPVRVVRGTRTAVIFELDDIVWRGRPASPEAVVLVDGASEAIAAWPEHVIAGTTWQPGRSRESIAALQARLCELVGRELVVLGCCHPAGPPICWCRKPLPGLALAFARDHDVDLSRSVHVGRSAADRGFARRAGMRLVVVDPR